MPRKAKEVREIEAYQFSNKAMAAATRSFTIWAFEHFEGLIRNPLRDFHRLIVFEN